MLQRRIFQEIGKSKKDKVKVNKQMFQMRSSSKLQTILDKFTIPYTKNNIKS